MSDKPKRTAGKLWVTILLILLTALILAAAIWVGVRMVIITRARSTQVTHEIGEWFEIAPEGIVSANGEPVYTQMRLGRENKIIVFFYGGGISYNDFMAARPFTGAVLFNEHGFYTDDVEGMIPDYCELGIGSSQPNNPFRDWTIIAIPYTTGDFHVGRAEYEYTALDGTEQTLHHHGYENYRAIMDEAVKHFITQPEELLIAGYSAGGYGAAILARDVLENYFPEAGHTTVCIDSSLLLIDDWVAVLRDVWNAPEEIVARVRSDNLIVDFLTDLYETYGESVTYLYVGSTRDGELTRYQSYFSLGVYAADNAKGRLFTRDLAEMLRQLRENIPGIGIYLFDSLPFSIYPFQMRLTQHTILETQTVYWRLTDRRSAIQWLADSVEGRVTSCGLNLLWR